MSSTPNAAGWLGRTGKAKKVRGSTNQRGASPTPTPTSEALGKSILVERGSSKLQQLSVQHHYLPAVKVMGRLVHVLVVAVLLLRLHPERGARGGQGDSGQSPTPHMLPYQRPYRTCKSRFCNDGKRGDLGKVRTLLAEDNNNNLLLCWGVAN